MKKSVREWIEKAEGDCVSAWREYRARNRPNYDSACFHAQQCVEKYLKAVLDAAGLPIVKAHDLAMLLNHCLRRQPLWSVMRDDLELLSQYAVLFRYPGHSADRAKARRALDAMQRCCLQIAPSLGIRFRP